MFIVAVFSVYAPVRVYSVQCTEVNKLGCACTSVRVRVNRLGKSPSPLLPLCLCLSVFNRSLVLQPTRAFFDFPFWWWYIKEQHLPVDTEGPKRVGYQILSNAPIRIT